MKESELFFSLVHYLEDEGVKYLANALTSNTVISLLRSIMELTFDVGVKYLAAM